MYALMLVFAADITINQTLSVKHLGWPSACPPESPLRHAMFNLNVPPLRAQRPLSMTIPRPWTLVFTHRSSIITANSSTTIMALSPIKS